MARQARVNIRDSIWCFHSRALFLANSRAPGYGRIWRIPLTFVIDRYGIVRKDGWFGDPGIDENLLEQTVTPLLRAR